jgi:hypothetical protein
MLSPSDSLEEKDKVDNKDIEKKDRKSRRNLHEDTGSNNRSISIKSTHNKKTPQTTLMRLDKIEKYLNERFDWMGLKRQQSITKKKDSPVRTRSKFMTT